MSRPREKRIAWPPLDAFYSFRMVGPSPQQLAIVLSSRSRAALARHENDEPLISRTLLDARSKTLLDDQALLSGPSRILVVAPPASGKTVLLRMLTERLLRIWDETGGATNLPIFVRGYDLDGDLADPAFVDVDGTQLSLSATLAALGSSPCTLIVDGFDEAPFPSQAADRIAELARVDPSLSVIVSCRPGAYREALGRFQTFTLAPLAQEQASTFIAHLFADEPALRGTFEEALRRYSARETLTANPFLLRMAADTYRQIGLLPSENPAEMMKDLVDQVVDKVPDDEALPLATVEDRLAALEELAVSLFAKGQSAEPLDELLSDVGLRGDSEERWAMIWWLERAELVRVDQGQIGFVHRSLLEFFVARRFRDDPAGLVALLSEFNEFSPEILRYAAGLFDELGPLIEWLIERGHLILAANCVAWGKSSNTALADHVIDLIERALEPRIFAQMVVRERAAEEIPAPPPTLLAPDRFDALLGLFDRALEEVPNHERGKRFEEFTNALFDGVFKPVSMNYRTEHGEIDIVMENVGQGHFWGEYGGDIFIECKNLNHSAEAHMVHTLASKAALAGRKLAFFVSLNGFSDPALAAIRTKSLVTGHPLLVPLSGADLRQALLRRVDLENFFKDQIRKVRHQGI